MKRKLIEYDVFEKMKANSLSAAVDELAECEEHLARALDRDSLKLESFDDGTVIYETSDGTFLKAEYTVDAKSVKFENIEELVINEETVRAETRKVVGNILEALLGDSDGEAERLFDEYMGLARGRYRRDGTLCPENLSEAYVRIYGTRGKGGKPRVSKRSGAKDARRAAAAREAHRKHPDSYKRGGRKRSAGISKERARRKSYKRQYGHLRALSGGQQYRRKLTEWLNLSENVFGWVDYKVNGHTLSESSVKTNENNDVVSVQLPSRKVRNEGKVQKQHYDKMMKTDVKVLREAARRLSANEAFCRAVAEIKRYNNVSDNRELEESIGGLVTAFPSVLYLTQTELAKQIAEALSAVGVSNYDDQTCSFMSEGILRVAHDAYSDRVNRLFQYAGAEPTTEGDSFLHFQKTVGSFFPTLDESIDLERKVFEDLYNATAEVSRLALDASSFANDPAVRADNDMVREDARNFLADLGSVLKGEQPTSIDLAEEVAGWLNDLAEASLSGGSWEVVRSPHQTWNGDHPQMAKNAKVPGVPGQNEGGWGDPAPMIGQEKMAYSKANAEEARNRSWGNKGGNKVWPSLDNPHVLSPFGDYTMKGEKGVDKDGNDFGTWSSKDTFPSLQNPYCPQSVKVHIKSDNRVDS